MSDTLESSTLSSTSEDTGNKFAKLKDVKKVVDRTNELKGEIADKATLENGVVKFWKASTEESRTDTLLYSVDISSIGGTGGLDLENLTLSVSQVGNYQRLSMSDGTTTKNVDIPITTITDEQVQNAVNNYMEANPIDETDPTVPDWAKNPQKPTYTASEVGALPNTTIIPTTLPNPNALTFTGAATGSYDGSSPVEINIPEGGGTDVAVDATLSVAGQAADAKVTGDKITELKGDLEKLQQGGESGSDYTLPIANPNRLGGVMPVAKTETMTHPVGVDEIGRLFVESSECNEGWVKVAEIQTTEDLTSLSITEDMDGNPLSFCEAIISVIISRSSDATSNGEFVMSVCPEWKNSFNNKGIYGLALLSDVYWYVGHFKKMNNLLIEQIISKKRIGNSLDLVTTWAENLPMALGTGSANGMISGVKNFDKNYYGNFLNSENKFQGVTIGTDLATSVKIGSGTRLEVWVR